MIGGLGSSKLLTHQFIFDFRINPISSRKCGISHRDCGPFELARTDTEPIRVIFDEFNNIMT